MEIQFLLQGSGKWEFKRTNAYVCKTGERVCEKIPKTISNIEVDLGKGGFTNLSNCIMCSRCVKTCPQKARSWSY
ncbi:MAG: 4Fe-4S binding protein [bacterium]